eukprot:GHRQ01010772.1.p1 GENE.GHRQ01010772.1~~GHRQ01010772.1.p1  ORF type:complete len:130 (-),score=1.77 GHRQ01010772.1:321-680(-)
MQDTVNTPTPPSPLMQARLPHACIAAHPRDLVYKDYLSTTQRLPALCETPKSRGVHMQWTLGTTDEAAQCDGRHTLCLLGMLPKRCMASDVTHSMAVQLLRCVQDVSAWLLKARDTGGA